MHAFSQPAGRSDQLESGNSACNDPTAIALHAEDDETRRPLFDESETRRTLRILNALFFAVAKLHGKPNPDKDAFGSSICLHRQFLWAGLAQARKKSAAKEPASSPLILSLMDRHYAVREIQVRSDGEDGKIEPPRRCRRRNRASSRAGISKECGTPLRTSKRAESRTRRGDPAAPWPQR